MKKYRTGGLMDSEGNPVRDGSGQPIMTGSSRDEAETEARMEAARKKLAGEVQEMVKEKKPTPSSAPSNNGDVDERDRRMEAAASAPKRMPTRPGQSSSGRKPAMVTKEQLEKSGFTNLRDYMNAQKGLKRRDGKAPERRAEAGSAASNKFPKASGAMIQSMDTDMMRTAGRTAAKEQGAKYSAGRKKSANEAAFKRAQAEAKTAEGKAKFNERIKGQALERVMPETALIGGGFGLKALHSAAKNLAGTGAKTTAKAASTGAKSPLRQKAEQLIREDKNPGRSFSSTSANPKTSLKEKTKELIQGDRTAKSSELSRQMAEKQKPTKFTSKKSTSAGKPVASKRTKKFNEEEAGIEFKRGGKVGASSASKRADGCAQRGKTRGKVY